MSISGVDITDRVQRFGDMTIDIIVDETALERRQYPMDILMKAHS